MKDLLTKKIKKREFFFVINLVLIAILLIFIFLLFKAKSYAYTIYTVTLDSGGADSSGTTHLYVKDNTVYIDPSFSKPITDNQNPITIPQKNGYIFNGYVVPSGHGSLSGYKCINEKGYMSNSISYVVSSGVVSLEAEWVSYSKINFDCNGGTPGTPYIYSINGEIKPRNYTGGNGPGVEMTSTTNPIGIPRRNAHKFLGFFYYGSGSIYGQLIDENGYWVASAPAYYYGNQTLKAEWEFTGEIFTLDGNGATNSDRTTTLYSETKTGGGSYNLYVDEDLTRKMTSSSYPIIKPQKPGYTFKGYYNTSAAWGLNKIIDENGYSTECAYIGRISYNAIAKWADETGPTITVNDINYGENLYITLEDLGSGVSAYTIINDNTRVPTWTTIETTSKTTIFKSGLDIGNYQILAKDADGNESSKDVTVSKANATNPSISGYTGSYDGKAHSIGVSGGSGGTIQYSTDNSNWSTTAPTRTDAGTTTVYVRVLGDSNHNTTSSISTTITITRAKSASASATNKTYNGSTQVGVTGSNVTLSGITQTVDAGTYTARATPTSNYAWSDGTYGAKTLTWNINAKSVVVNWGATSIFTYNGVAQAPTASAISGVTGETINITRTTQTNAGSYTSTASIASVSGGRARKENYTLTENTKGYTINAKSIAVSWGETIEFKYNGGAQAPTASVASGVTGETINVTRTTQTSAGSYTSTASIASVSGGQQRKENYTLTENTKAYTIYYSVNYSKGSNILVIGDGATKVYSNNLVLPTISPEIGYSSAGWYEETNKIGDANNTINISNNMNLVAKSIPNQYTVSYDYKGATAANTVPNKAVTYDAIYGSLPSPIRKYTVSFDSQGGTDCSELTSNYVFDGWYKGNQFVNEVESTTIVKTPNNHTLYAKWTPTAVELPEPTRRGYTFKGWLTSKTGNDVISNPTTSNYSNSYIPQEDITLYAKWEINQYTLTVDPNNGTWNGNKGVTYYKQDFNSTKYIPEPSIEGYITTFSNEGGYAVLPITQTTSFDEWKLESSVEGEGNINGTTFTYGASDTTLTAQYNRDNIILPEATKPGNTFIGWYTEDGYKAGEAGDSYTPPSDVILYAQYAGNDYNLYVDPNGGTWNGSKDVQTVLGKYGTSRIIETPTAPNGYTITLNNNDGTGKTEKLIQERKFIGWNSIAQGSINQNEYTYGAGDGNIVAVYTTNEPIELPSANREGYIFEYWYDATTNTKIGKAGDKIVPTSNMNIYAKWAPRTDTNYKVEHYIEKLDGGYELKETNELKGTTESVIAAEAHVYDGFTINESVNGTVKTGIIAADGSLILKLYYTRNSYTLLFDSNGGELSQSQKTVKYEDAYGELPIPTKEGHTFNGWYKAKDSDEKVSSATIYNASTNITIYAKWIVNESKLTINPNEGIWNGYVASVDYKQKYGTTKEIVNPSKGPNGYTVIFSNINGQSVENITQETRFVNWELEGAGSISGTTFTYGNGDATLKAIYEGCEIELPGAIKEGNTFKGWYTSDGIKIGERGSKYIPTSNITLYAKYETDNYDLTINPNGGTWNGSTSNSIVGGSYNSLISIKNPITPKGYKITYKLNDGTDKIQEEKQTTTFIGWDTQGIGNLSGKTYKFGAGDETITANYEEDAVILKTATRSGYTFEGWYTESGEKIGEANQEYYPKEDITLFAKWSANKYVVSFNTNDGDLLEADSKEVTYGETYGELPIPTKGGYSFVCWVNDKGQKIDRNSIVSIVEDETLTAKWILGKFTVTFDAQGGEVNPNSKEITYSYEYGTLPIPTREGYTFAGWWDSKEDLANEITKDTIVRVTENHSIYAKWIANKYNINYDYKGATGNNTETNKELTFDEKYGELPYPTRSYSVTFDSQGGMGCADLTGKYTFAGWYLEEGYTNIVDKDTIVKTAQDHTLYAKWTDGSIELPMISREGYTFIGWYDEDGNKIGNIGDRYYPRANTRLYAHWVDDIKPTLPVYTNSSSENWTNRDVIITLRASDNGTGLKNYQYSNDNINWKDLSEDIDENGSIKITYKDEINNEFYYRVVDNAGNISDTVSTVIRIDKTKPSAPVLSSSSNENWTNTEIIIKVSATDDSSGLSKFQYSTNNNSFIDSGLNIENNTIEDTWSSEIETPVYYRAVDKAGNVSDSTQIMVRIDKTLPTLTITPNEGNYSKTLDVRVTANDGGGSGLSESNSYQYYLSSSNIELLDGEWLDYENDKIFSIGTNVTGTRYLWIKQVQDTAGNKSISNIEGYTVSNAYIFDNTAPSIITNDIRYGETLSVKFRDNGIGIIDSWGITEENEQSTLNWENINNSGEVTVTKTGLNVGTYYIWVKDSLGNINSKQIKVNSKDTTGNLEISLSQTSYVYDGQAKEPETTVKEGENVLQRDIDYQVTYSNNINTGMATVTVEGIGNYSGTNTTNFEITRRILEVKAEAKEKIYEEQDPVLTYTYANNVENEIPKFSGSLDREIGENVGEYAIKQGSLKIEDNGTFIVNNYEVKYTEAKLVIKEKELNPQELEISLSQTSYVYDGQAKEPETTVKEGENVLQRGIDYQVTYSNNVNVGTATVTVEGIGNYSGTNTTNFEITRRILEVKAEAKDKIYGEQDPALTYTYSNNVESETPKFSGNLEREDGENVGEYAIKEGTLTIEDNGVFIANNYEVKYIEAKLTIKTKEVSSEQLEISLSQTGYVYDGQAKEPETTVKEGENVLQRDIDYQVTYSNNVNVGTATVTLKGIGNYSVTSTIDFEIVKRTLEIKAEAKDKIYGEQDPALTYTYSNNVESETPKFSGSLEREDGENIGEYAIKQGSLRIEDNGAFIANNYETKYIEAKLTIKTKEVSSEQIEISLSQTSYVYDGQAKEPEAIVKYGERALQKDIDYQVTYSNNVNAGIAKVTVKGISNFAGEKEVMFTIIKKEPEYTLPEITVPYWYKLSDIKLSEGFTFEDNLSTNVGKAGIHTFKVTFTPIDIDNYNIINGVNLSITVIDKNIDIDGDGKPDVNIDTDGDGKPDLNIDINGDGKPNVNIDTDGDGTVDTDKIGDISQSTDKVNDEDNDIYYSKEDYSASNNYSKDGLTIYSSIYIFGNKYMERITPRTTVEVLKSWCVTNGNLEVYDVGGMLKKKDTDYVGTGMIVKVTKDETVLTFTAVVQGDTSGDGFVSSSDLAKVQFHILNKKLLEGAQFRAADINRNKAVTGEDLATIRREIQNMGEKDINPNYVKPNKDTGENVNSGSNENEDKYIEEDTTTNKNAVEDVNVDKDVSTNKNIDTNINTNKDNSSTSENTNKEELDDIAQNGNMKENTESKKTSSNVNTIEQQATNKNTATNVTTTTKKNKEEDIKNE